MWWPLKPVGKPTALAAGFAVVVSLCLAGCGYEPLYRQGPHNGSTVQASLAAITVDWLPDRTVQELRNALEERLAAHAGERAGRYHLRIVLIDAATDVALRRLDNTVSRSDMNVTATWTLLEDDRVVRQGKAQAVLNYAVQSNQYPTIASIKSAEAQGAQLVADDIIRQLQGYFSGLPTPSEPPVPLPVPPAHKPSL